MADTPTALPPAIEARLDAYRDAIELHTLGVGSYAESSTRKAETRAALSAEIGALLADAERWRALIGCDRVRMIGGARLGTPTAHLGMEFWLQYDTDGSRSYAECNAGSVAELTQFADAARRSTPSATPDA